MNITLKNLSSPNVLCMNIDGHDYIFSSDNKVEIDFKKILQEQNNFQAISDIFIELKRIKDVSTEKKQRDELVLLYHSMNSLKSILLLISKIVNSIDEMNKIPPIEKDSKKSLFTTDIGIQSHIQDIAPCVYTYYDELLITYFESLLVHSQGLLDKLSIYIQRHKIYDSSDELLIFKEEIDEHISQGKISNPNDFHPTKREKKKKLFYFSNLKGIIDELNRNNPKDIVYQSFHREIQLHSSSMYDLIVSNGKASLRNKIVHEESIMTLNDNVFVAYRTKKGKIVKFDSPILDDYPPIIESVYRILTSLPQLTVNVISSILNDKFSTSLKTNHHLKYGFYNTFIDFRKYILEEASEEDKVKLNKFDIFEDNFSLENFYFVKRSLFQ